MSKVKFHLSIISIIFFASCNSQNDEKIWNPSFEKEMLSALNLKFINSDSLYSGALTTVFKDTIVGYQMFGFKGDSNEDYKNFYFMQSLKDVANIKSKMVKIPIDAVVPEVANLRYSNQIDTLIDGCLYFGQFGGSKMLKLCYDGTLKEYFKKYENDMFYAKKIFLHKDKTIIISMNAIYVYNTNNQSLLFKHKFYNDISESVNGKIIGDDFVFREVEENWTRGDEPKPSMTEVIRAIDLIKLNYRWIYKSESGLKGVGKISYNKNYVAFGAYLIDLESGKLNHFFKNFAVSSTEKDGGYIGYNTSFGKDYADSTIVKLDKKYQTIWKVNQVSSIDYYGNYIIGIRRKKEKEYVVIINRITGNIEKEILCYSKGTYGFKLLNGYVLLNGCNLYK